MYAIFYTLPGGAYEHSLDACGLFPDLEEAKALAAKHTRENLFGGTYHAVDVELLAREVRAATPQTVIEKIVEKIVEKRVDVPRLPEVLTLRGTPLGKDVESANPVGSYALINGVSYRLHSSDVHGNDTYRREEP